MVKEELIKIDFYESVRNKRHKTLRYDIYFNDNKECYVELLEKFNYVMPCMVVIEDDVNDVNAHQSRLYMQNCGTIKKLQTGIKKIESLFGNIKEI